MHMRRTGTRVEYMRAKVGVCVCVCRTVHISKGSQTNEHVLSRGGPLFREAIRFVVGREDGEFFSQRMWIYSIYIYIYIQKITGIYEM